MTRPKSVSEQYEPLVIKTNRFIINGVNNREIRIEVVGQYTPTQSTGRLVVSIDDGHGKSLSSFIPFDSLYKVIEKLIENKVAVDFDFDEAYEKGKIIPNSLEKKIDSEIETKKLKVPKNFKLTVCKGRRRN